MCKHISDTERKRKRNARLKQQRDNWTPEQRQAHNDRCNRYRRNNRKKANAIQQRYRAKKKRQQTENQDRG